MAGARRCRRGRGRRPGPGSRHPDRQPGQRDPSAGPWRPTARCGVRVLRYFNRCEAQLRGIEAVLADGTVVSHLAGADQGQHNGYDYPSLLTGSEGTLAVITQAPALDWSRGCGTLVHRDYRARPASLNSTRLLIGLYREIPGLVSGRVLHQHGTRHPRRAARRPGCRRWRAPAQAYLPAPRLLAPPRSTISRA